MLKNFVLYLLLQMREFAATEENPHHVLSKIVALLQWFSSLTWGEIVLCALTVFAMEQLAENLS